MGNLLIHAKATNNTICSKYYDNLILRKQFHLTSKLNVPDQSDDGTEWIGGITGVQSRWGYIDGHVKELCKEVLEIEKLYGSEHPESENLADYIEKRMVERNEFIESHLKDETSFDSDSNKKDQSQWADKVVGCYEKDIETLSKISATRKLDVYPYNASEGFMDQAKLYKKSAEEFVKELDKSDLPVVDPSSPDQGPSSQNSSTPFRQDSSDVHQTDFSSCEPWED